jgi:hypothetical protein
MSPGAADGQCGDVGECARQAAVCDGPEDCAAAEVCCVTQQGTDCRDSAQCIGNDSYALCRATDDCPHGTDECLPADPPLIGYCD